MEQQEYFLKMQMLGQEAEKLEQQVQSIEQQISEMNAVKESVSALESGKEKEMLANLGKGVFVQAEIKNSDFFVNVGKEIIVKKNPKEMLKIFDEQIKRLLDGKQEFANRLEALQAEMHGILKEMQKEQKISGKQHNPECKCGEGEECECGDECGCGHSHEK